MNTGGTRRKAAGITAALLCLASLSFPAYADQAENAPEAVSTEFVSEPIETADAEDPKETDSTQAEKENASVQTESTEGNHEASDGYRVYTDTLLYVRDETGEATYQEHDGYLSKDIITAGPAVPTISGWDGMYPLVDTEGQIEGVDQIALVDAWFYDPEDEKYKYILGDGMQILEERNTDPFDTWRRQYGLRDFLIRFYYDEEPGIIPDATVTVVLQHASIYAKYIIEMPLGTEWTTVRLPAGIYYLDAYASNGYSLTNAFIPNMVIALNDDVENTFPKERFDINIYVKGVSRVSGAEEIPVIEEPTESNVPDPEDENETKQEEEVESTEEKALIPSWASPDLSETEAGNRFDVPSVSEPEKGSAAAKYITAAIVVLLASVALAAWWIHKKG